MLCVWLAPVRVWVCPFPPPDDVMVTVWSWLPAVVIVALWECDPPVVIVTV